MNDAVAVVAAQRVEFVVDRSLHGAFFFEFAQRRLLGRLARFAFSAWELPLSAEVNVGMALGDEPEAILVNDSHGHTDRRRAHSGKTLVMDAVSACISATQ